jgi:hypothetical protein
MATLLIVAAISARAQTAATVPQPPKYSTVIQAVIPAPLDSVKHRVIHVLASRTPDMDTVTIDGVHRIQTVRFYMKGAGLLQIAARVRPDSAGAVVELSGTRRFMNRILHVLTNVGDEVPLFSGGDDAQVRRSWDELMAIATELRPSRVSYSRRP